MYTLLSKRTSIKRKGRLTFSLSILVSLSLYSLFSLFLFPAIGTAHADGFPIIGVLHAGNRPEGIAVDTSTHMVYVGYEDQGTVVGFDPVGNRVQWRTTIGDTTTDVLVDSANHRVYAISDLFQNSVARVVVLDGANGRLLFSRNAPAGDESLALDTKRKILYVAGANKGEITAFSFVTLPNGSLTAQSTTLHIGSHPQAIGVNSRLGRLYVGDTDKNTVIVYDEASRRVLATIPVADQPTPPLRVDEASGRVYVVCSNGQELDVIDGNKNSVMARIPVAPFPEGVAFNTATGRIYVADEGNADSSNHPTNGTTITVIDGQSLQVLGTLSIGQAPDGVEADPQLQRVYVSVENSNAVVEVSDSVDLPLIPDTNFHEEAASHQAIALLQDATMITLILMLVTIVGATLGVLLPRWRARGNLRTLPADESSRSEIHSPPA
jgi:YVTN family beta-propeller protein